MPAFRHRQSGCSAIAILRFGWGEARFDAKAMAWLSEYKFFYLLVLANTNYDLWYLTLLL